MKRLRVINEYTHVVGYLMLAACPSVACWVAERFADTPAGRTECAVMGQFFLVLQVVLLGLVWVVFGLPVAAGSPKEEIRELPKFYTAENCRWFVEGGLWERLSEDEKAGLLAAGDLSPKERHDA